MFSRALRGIAFVAFSTACYAIAGGIGLAAWHFGGWLGVIAWLGVALALCLKFTPNGWADV